MIEDCEWECIVGPTHILDKNYNFLPVYLGFMLNGDEEEWEDEDEPEDMMVITISSDNYTMIDNNKPYVFIHQPDHQPMFDDLDLEMKYKVADILKLKVKNPDCMYREHMHIW